MQVPEEGQKAESWTSSWVGLQIWGFYPSVGVTVWLPGTPKGLFLNKNPSHLLI